MIHAPPFGTSARHAMVKLVLYSQRAALQRAQAFG